MVKAVYSRIAMSLIIICSPFILRQTTNLCLKLFQAIENGEIEKVKVLVDQGVDVNCRGPYKQSPLIVAVRKNQLEIAELLCSNNADLNAKSEFADPMSDYTPLMWAIDGQNVRMAEYLLAKGADVNIHDSWGNSPLILAASKDNLPLVKLLVLKGAAVTYRRKPGSRSAIFEAVQNGNISIVELLTQYGEDPKTKDSNGWTLLMWAVHACRPNLVGYFLDKGIDVNSKGEMGTTAMHLAAKHDSAAGVGILTRLIRAGGELNSRDILGETPLMAAAHEGATEAAKVLIDHGAKVDDRNVDGKTPLHLAARKWRPTKNEDIVEILLEKGALVNIADKDGITPLMVASLNASATSIRALLKGGAYINSQDNKGWTALMYAASENQVENIKLLFDNGADPSIRSIKGNTALQIAGAKKGTREACSLLRTLSSRK
jgi:ankyrin repeat protein